MVSLFCTVFYISYSKISYIPCDLFWLIWFQSDQIVCNLLQVKKSIIMFFIIIYFMSFGGVLAYLEKTNISVLNFEPKVVIMCVP